MQPSYNHFKRAQLGNWVLVFCCKTPLFCFEICEKTRYEVYKGLRNIKINRARAKTAQIVCGFISRWSLLNDELSWIRVLNLYIKLLTNDKQYRHFTRIKKSTEKGCTVNARCELKYWIPMLSIIPSHIIFDIHIAIKHKKRHTILIYISMGLFLNFSSRQIIYLIVFIRYTFSWCEKHMEMEFVYKKNL